MIWVHCGDDGEAASSLSIVTRLMEYDDNVEVVLTADDDLLPSFAMAPAGADIVAVPTDTPAKVRDFLAEWAPRHLIWNGGALRPVLLRQARKDGISATLINARHGALLTGSSRWLPRATRTAVDPFDRILTADGATATRLTRGGVPRERVTVTGPILEEPTALPHDANELTVMVEAVSTRPLWFAADILPTEVGHMATAHLSASRKNHRLLLLIAPRDPETGPQVADMLREAGLKVGVRSQGDDPEPEHQAYVADIEGELGLWYRISPLTFMGGTLRGRSQDQGAISPFAPVSLGSAVLHGPRKAPFEARYARLASAEASREIRSAGELGIAVGALVSPEQTARMALAGWAEISQNAATINELVAEAVDRNETAGGDR